MKLLHNISFAKQLILYLLMVLITGFIFISLILTNSVELFIRNNAHSQAQTIATNVQVIFEREINKIENTPSKITEIYGYLNNQNASTLPLKILKSYSILTGCSVYYVPNDLYDFPSSSAFRDKNGNIKVIAPRTSTIYNPEKIIRRNAHGGYWIYSQINDQPSIAYCLPIYDEKTATCGVLKLELSLKTIKELICDYQLYKSGYLFITDTKGDYVVDPSTDSSDPKHMSQSAILYDSGFIAIKQDMINGLTGSNSFVRNKEKFFIYFTPIHCIDWRLGLICPYSEMMTSTNKLYLLIFICLSAGMLFLFLGMVNIIHRLSNPLKQLAYTTRQIAHGRFDIFIPEQNSSHEIKELYNSFRYMQQSLINYIERLKVSTAAREQINTEMSLARGIQQRFLPNPIELPSNIILTAELHQSREVGGDLYEYFISDNNLYFAIGDVSGKGIPAALYMASVTKLFRYVANYHNSTSTICNIINEQMCDNSEDGMFITMFIGILDINTGIIKYTNAGHPYPFIIHSDGIPGLLSKQPEIPIGIIANHCFKENTYTLNPNSSLLLYTDGVTDSENSSGQFYTRERLIKRIMENQNVPPEKLIQIIYADITEHIGNMDLSDDLTLLDIHYKGIPKH